MVSISSTYSIFRVQCLRLLLWGLWAMVVIPSAGAEPITFEGRVLSAPEVSMEGVSVEGASVEGASVELIRWLSSWEAAEAWWQRSEPTAGPTDSTAVTTTRSGAGGQYALSVPSLGAWRVRVVAPGFVPAILDVPPTVTDGRLPDVVLRPSSVLWVRVVDGKGQPVPGLGVAHGPVRRELHSEHPWRSAERWGVTDATGLLALEAPVDEVLAVAAVGEFSYLREILDMGASGSQDNPRTLTLDRDLWPVRLETDRGQLAAEVTAAFTSPFLPLAPADPQGMMALPSLDDGDAVRFSDAAGALGTPTPVGWDAEGWMHLRLPDSKGVGGRVLDAIDGRPLDGAWLWPMDADGGTLAAPGRTDARGRFHRWRAAGQHSWWVMAEGYLPRRVGLPSDPRARFEAALMPALGLSGRVVDAAGRGLAGVDLRLEAMPETWMAAGEHGDPQRSARALPEGMARTARTDGDGVFELSPVIPGAAFTVHLTREGLVSRTLAIEPLVREEGTRSLEITMDPGVALLGEVVDGEHRPVDGARVTVRPANAPALEPVSTDALGRFRVPDLGGVVHLEVSAEGFAPTALASIELERAGPNHVLESIVLGPESVVEGRVVDSDGRPVVAARVWARQPGSVARSPIEHTVHTGEDGEFSIPGLDPAGRLQVRVTHPGYQEGTIHGVVGIEGSPFEIVLRRGIPLQGRVLDAEGTLVSNARVQLTTSSGRSLAVETAADGSFEFPAQPPGRVTLQAVARTHRASPRHVWLDDRHGEYAVDLELDGRAVVEGRVVGPSGGGIPGVRVSGLAGDHAEATHTNADGMFRLEGLDGGVIVVADHRDYERARRVVSAASTDPVEIALGARRVPRTISGYLVNRSGEGVAGVTVEAIGRGVRGRHTPKAWTTSRAEGVFEISVPGDGLYTLRVAHPYSGQRDLSVAVAGDDLVGVVIEFSAR